MAKELFMNGPADGLLVEVGDGPAEFTYNAKYQRPVTYYRKEIQARVGEFVFYTHEPMRSEEVIKRLCEYYASR